MSELDETATSPRRKLCETLRPPVLKRSPETSNAETEFVLMRLRAPEGVLTADQLQALAQVAGRHGSGFVQVVSRSLLEVPANSLEALHEAQALLGSVGLGPASAAAGKSLTGCSGQGRCRTCHVDVNALLSALGSALEGELAGVAVRVVVAGCLRGCSAPQAADIGLAGVAEPALLREKCRGESACVQACEDGALVMRRGLPRRDPERCTLCGACIAACTFDALRPARLGYAVYVGGKAGRRPQRATLLLPFVAEADAPELVTRILAFVTEHARPRESFSTVLRRLGTDALRAAVASRAAGGAVARK